jgi:hypothetical protein
MGISNYMVSVKEVNFNKKLARQIGYAILAISLVDMISNSIGYSFPSIQTLDSKIDHQRAM